MTVGGTPAKNTVERLLSTGAAALLPPACVSPASMAATAGDTGGTAPPPPQAAPKPGRSGEEPARLEVEVGGVSEVVVGTCTPGNG